MKNKIISYQAITDFPRQKFIGESLGTKLKDNYLRVITRFIIWKNTSYFTHFYKWNCRCDAENRLIWDIRSYKKNLCEIIYAKLSFWIYVLTYWRGERQHLDICSSQKQPPPKKQDLARCLKTVLIIYQKQPQPKQ